MSELPSNPYQDVERVEKALALALRVPRFPPRPEKGKQAVSLGPAFGELVQLMRAESWSMRANLTNYLGARMPGDIHQVFALDPSSWGAKRGHHSMRDELIDLLVRIRHAMLDELRTLPVPDEHGRWVRQAPWRMPESQPVWDKLVDREQHMLLQLGSGRKSGKELAKKLRCSYDAARKVAGRLATLGLIESVGRDGYVIVRTPLNAPAAVRAVTDPPAATR